MLTGPSSDRQCRGENTTKRTNENVPQLDRDFNKDISSFMCEARRRGGDRDRDRDRPGRDGRDGRDGRP